MSTCLLANVLPWVCECVEEQENRTLARQKASGGEQIALATRVHTKTKKKEKKISNLATTSSRDVGKSETPQLRAFHYRDKRLRVRR